MHHIVFWWLMPPFFPVPIIFISMLAMSSSMESPFRKLTILSHHSALFHLGWGTSAYHLGWCWLSLPLYLAPAYHFIQGWYPFYRLSRVSPSHQPLPWSLIIFSSLPLRLFLQSNMLALKIILLVVMGINQSSWVVPGSNFCMWLRGWAPNNPSPGTFSGMPGSNQALLNFYQNLSPTQAKNIWAS